MVPADEDQNNHAPLNNVINFTDDVIARLSEYKKRFDNILNESVNQEETTRKAILKLFSNIDDNATLYGNFKNFLKTSVNKKWNSIARTVHENYENKAVGENQTYSVAICASIRACFSENDLDVNDFLTKITKLKGIGKAIATGLLFFRPNSKYFCWNGKVDTAFKKLGITDEYNADNYLKVNKKVNAACDKLGINLWKMDTLFHLIASESEAPFEVKPQVVFYGVPGTGKTYIAQLIANYGGFETTIIQFHPNYTYEEFIEGIRPEIEQAGDVKYKYHSGIFKELCRKAFDNPTKKYLIIIDEINRGNIPKIFGELMYLLEYRFRIFYIEGDTNASIAEINKSIIDATDNKINWGRPFREFDNITQEDTNKIDENEYKILKNYFLQLPYSKEYFCIPDNVYIIGTMNTADRSIALFDLALRRRFTFYEFKPNVQYFTECFNSDSKVSVLQDENINNINLGSWLNELNSSLTKKLGEDYQIGHSYFIKNEEETDELYKNRILSTVKFQIKPLIKEYCNNDNEKMKNLIVKLDFKKQNETGVQQNDENREGQ